MKVNGENDSRLVDATPARPMPEIKTRVGLLDEGGQGDGLLNQHLM